MPFIDVFKSQPGFDLLTLSAAIMERPYQPDIIENLGIFEVEPVTTQRVEIQRERRILRLLPDTPRGVSLPRHTDPTWSKVPIDVRRIGEWDSVYAAEVSDRIAFGTENEVEVINELLGKRADDMLLDARATIEYLRMGALSGIVLDADGTTELVNLFTVFNMTQASSVSFELDVTTTDVRSICHQVIRTIQAALDIRTRIEVIALVDDTFMDALTSHGSVRDTFLNMQDAGRLREPVANIDFAFGGIRFIEYNAAVPSADDLTTPIDFLGTAGSGKAFARVPGLFKDYRAPIDKFGIVNTPGLPFYTYIEGDGDKDESITEHVESRPLPICTRPESLIPITLT